MTPEGRVKEAFKKGTKGIKYLWGFFPVPLYNIGIPDWVGVVRGKFIAVEFKADAGKVRRIQHLIHEKIRGAGGLVYVAYPSNVEDVVKELRCLSSIKD